MTKAVASTAPAYLLKVRSLIVPKSALYAAGAGGRRKRGNPAPCCVRLSYTLPALAQPPKHRNEPHRPHPRAHGRDPTAREGAGGRRRSGGRGGGRFGDRGGGGGGRRPGGADRSRPALGFGPDRRRPGPT